MKRTEIGFVVPVLLAGPIQAGNVIGQTVSAATSSHDRFLALPQMGGLIDPMGSSGRADLEMLA